MKKNLLLIVIGLTYFAGYVLHGCKKDKLDDVNAPSTPGISTSFTEEFDTVYNAFEKKDWVTKSSINAWSATWSQGFEGGQDKSGVWYGFPAYSFRTNQDEYAGIFVFDNTAMINSWLITPMLYVKNGNKISFYTRGSDGAYADRLQVRLNWNASTEIGDTFNNTGDFKTTVIDINPTQATKGYPLTWKKYEYSFSGLSKPANVRIGFRYFVPTSAKAKGIGIDQFKFEVQ